MTELPRVHFVMRVIFTLRDATNVTISISILQILRSWVATSHRRPPTWRFYLTTIRYARACSSDGIFIPRAARLCN